MSCPGRGGMRRPLAVWPSPLRNVVHRNSRYVPRPSAVFPGPSFLKLLSFFGIRLLYPTRCQHKCGLSPSTLTWLILLDCSSYLHRRQVCLFTPSSQLTLLSSHHGTNKSSFKLILIFSGNFITPTKIKIVLQKNTFQENLYILNVSSGDRLLPLSCKVIPKDNMLLK